MTLTKTQSKVVADATDLLRRLRNEKRKGVKLPNREAIAASEFHSEGPTHVQRLLTTIKQLSDTVNAQEARKHEVLARQTQLTEERDELKRQFKEARAELRLLPFRATAGAWREAATWLREQAAVEFIEGKNNEAAKVLRRLYHRVNHRARQFEQKDALVTQSPPMKDLDPSGEFYVLSMPDKRPTMQQIRKAQDYLVDIGQGPVSMALLSNGHVAVDYVMGARIQNHLVVELGIEGVQLQRPA